MIEEFKAHTIQTNQQIVGMEVYYCLDALVHAQNLRLIEQKRNEQQQL